MFLIYCAITFLGAHILVFLLLNFACQKTILDSLLYKQIFSAWRCTTVTRISNDLQLSIKRKDILSVTIVL